MIYLYMIMTLAFASGESASVVIKKVPAPTMQECQAFVDTQGAEALIADDGTIIYTHLECGKEI